MPIYTFACEDCDEIFEIVSSFKDYTSDVCCPVCESDKTYREFAADTQIIRDDSHMTLGTLAEQNASERRKQGLSNHRAD